MEDSIIKSIVGSFICENYQVGKPLSSKVGYDLVIRKRGGGGIRVSIKTRQIRSNNTMMIKSRNFDADILVIHCTTNNENYYFQKEEVENLNFLKFSLSNKNPERNPDNYRDIKRLK